MKNPIQTDDLVFVEVPGKSEKPRALLVRADRVQGDVLRGVVEEHRHLTASHIEVPLSAVMMNVGPDPFPGKVYGYDLSYLFRRYRAVPALGDVAFFCKVTKDEVTQLREAAASLYRRLTKAKLDFVFDDPVSYEVVSKQYAGKWAGMYSRAKKEGDSHRIQVTLDKSRLETSSIGNYEYVLAHEIGHHVHYQYVKGTSPADAAWIRAYQETVRPLMVDSKLVKTFLEHLLHERSVRSLIAETEADLQPQLKRVLKEVRSSAGLGPRELDRLLEVHKDDDLQKAWPQSGLMLSEKHPSVTEYALKNYHELFAESFAFYLLGRELPKKLTKLMEHSLSLARSQRTA
jgi:hypothetical protein